MGVFEAPEQSRMIIEEKRKYSNFNENYKATDPRRQVQLPISHEYQVLSHDFFQGFSFFCLGHISTNMLISELLGKCLVACSFSQDRQTRAFLTSHPTPCVGPR